MKNLSRFFLLPFLFFLLILNGQLVFAEPLCMKNTHSEEDINICQYAEAKRLELELNDLEESIRSRFKSPQLDRLNEAQKYWQQMTGKDCEIESDFYEGATIYPAIQSECLQRHYQDRMETLKKYLCQEHNLGSGCDSTEQASIPVSVPSVQLPAAETREPSTTVPAKIKGAKRFR